MRSTRRPVSGSWPRLAGIRLGLRLGLGSGLANLSLTLTLTLTLARQPSGRARPRRAAPPQVFIAWRFSEALAVGRAAGQRYLWLHDEIRPETVPAAVLPLLDGAMVLSAFHGSQLPYPYP